MLCVCVCVRVLLNLMLLFISSMNGFPKNSKKQTEFGFFHKHGIKR